MKKSARFNYIILLYLAGIVVFTLFRVAETLVEAMENSGKYEEMYVNCPIAIHVDAGNSTSGKTRELIPELVGWIKACGYDCSVKPDSFVASTIADRLSK